MIEVYDNFLDENNFKNIKYWLEESGQFPWYYNPNITYPEKRNNNDINNYMFTHKFYGQYSICSDFYHLIVPIIEKINPIAIVRIKANLNPHTEHPYKSDFHVDYNHKNLHTAIYYVNTNNGSTIFENGKEIICKENRFAIFPCDYKHQANSTTNKRVKIAINFNFIL